MLPLDSPLWRELWHMYTGQYEGQGEPDANVLLERIEQASNDEEFHRASRDFFEVVYHQGDFCPASYSVVPHLAKMCLATGSVDWQSSLLLMIGLIENARLQRLTRSRKGALNFEVSQAIASEYHDIIDQMPQLVARCAGSQWSQEVGIKFTAALLFTKGLDDLGSAVLEFRVNGEHRLLQCGKCGEWVKVPKPGETDEPSKPVMPTVAVAGPLDPPF